MKRLKVLDLRDTYEIGGPGKTILETFRAIDATRFDLHLGVFLARSERDSGPFIDAARSIGMPVHVIRGYNQYDPRMIWEVARLVKNERIDIVHAHEVKSDVITYLASKLCRVPIVTTMHGWIGNSAKQRAFIAMDRLVARGFDRVIAVSRPIHAALAGAGVIPPHLRLLHNGIVLDRYRRTGQVGHLATLIGKPPAFPVIATIGRLSPEKGQWDLVEALGMVAAKGHRVTAVLAGDGSDRARLEAKVASLGLEGSVHFPGYVSRPELILQEADLMVLPSHTEGLPNAALEAMMMEVPVLATNVGGTPEVVIDGENGRLVEARSPDAMAQAIIDFLINPAPWKRMATRGRELVEQNFDFQTRTRHLEALYLEMVEAKAP